ncbi:MAG: helix-turn-helix domain-containing protein [Candidatus Ventricola sp.]
MVKFGERLKAARTAKHMSQQALADVIGKSLNTVGLYERGLRQPSLETLCLLADTLDVSCDYLLARTEAKKTTKMSDAADEDLAMRVSRIENHLGLD